MIVLASKSPRRKEILQNLGYTFEIWPAKKEEVFELDLGLDQALKKVALSKALEVQTLYPDEIIVSADTIVCVDDKILGKPKSKEEAFSTLKMLSNRSHQVKTGVSVMYKDLILVHVETTNVTFKNVSEDAILAYVQSGKCMDKAGSYGIQECDFVKEISGDYSNVVGLPSRVVDSMLKCVALQVKKC